ncbi:hypothetical protein EST38_g464 [Candolleomyces aberdarensis]|uniref:Caspase domain-containing protein n=1 Tax=Candolleomyces aberdarensis TaxID=2316362 RepID=A0A4Q2DXY1_9AGAR|nr:hypothetical protein EST38_g464 [Candolleomyces aberdarensis]
MNSNDEKHRVVASGIQDVAAFLPLFGTGQCERLVTSALERGLLHAAATPMSIFGSLGIAKAGFVVLWGSTDFRWFPGPSLLRNAGITPSGIGELLVHVAEDYRHLYAVEDKLRCRLAKKRIQSVKVNLLSKDFILWNVCLVCATVFLSAFALLPYTFLITQPLSNQPLQTTWLYPILRIGGCDIVAISIQFIFQLRILEESYCRIRFMATDALIRKDHGKALPPFWDPNERAQRMFKRLRSLCRSNHELSGIQRGLGTLSSFSFPLDPPPESDPTVLPPSTLIFATTPILYVCQAALLFGLLLVAVGYIGCFRVVRASLCAEGVLVWLVGEALLAMIRTLLCAANSRWDDTISPIALEKVIGTSEDGSSYGIGWMLNAVTADDMHAVIVGIDEYKSRIFLDLTECVPDAKRVASYLEDTLLVPRDQIVTLYNGQATKKRIIEELEALSRKAFVAQGPPIIIYFASHSFVEPDNKRAYLVPHAPQVHQDEGDSNLADACISYDSIVGILRHIAENKTDNIILILDFCHAAATGMAVESTTEETDDGVVGNEVHSSGEDVSGAQFDDLFRSTTQSIPSDILVDHSSHILIAGTDAGDIAPEQQGEFTRSLLKSLKKPSAREEMTYKKLVDEINAEMQGTGQHAICTEIHQNCLLFNGLFSRRVREDGVAPVIKVRYSDL